jgi:hypothetical protein
MPVSRVRKKPAKARNSLVKVGIVWYRSAEEYDRLKTTFTDAASLPKTYEEWQAKILELTSALAGHTIVKVYIDPEEFAAWCKARRFKRDEKARAQFARECVELNKASCL